MDSNKVKVVINYKDGTTEAFYADSTHNENDRIVFWQCENTIISIPMDAIKRIVETE